MDDKQLRVCMVDDDASFRFLTKKLCEKIPAISHIDEFADIYDALRFLMANKRSKETLPDVILLDLDFPALNGWEFMEGYVDLVTTMAKQVPVYLISSSILKADKEKAKEFDIVKGFISKPLELGQLQRIIESIQ